ncbi:hypothetical protein CLOBY_20380 [Clostridium saccharobutylicum]|uniref:hypothetical protein n=1 Tax=Clostridium saccharobutylicum TaxID=169679 RepID=UPI0009839C05|nr:hypothetical protein [Clostridium saccharobutylicum]AQS09899.1 hypothetical protein CLOBY_20380 [Clostridium saccharobutylicum]MBC2437051.1 hypothetical protein [Clostridium saccharobutylicum]NSB89505.1 hypothetical protein [Clostridium saccharobutylicum]NYC27695.1 hypothetical protein [Clostridium saccharobutylicum]OOM12776.1 hypothetical protein CLSAB_36720 [Clostridium saccharobutylicum]
MDFLMDQHRLFTSKKYENVYFLFKEKYDISYDELFILCAAIGFKNNKRTTIGEKGREFRTNYFKRDSKATAYSIILNDPELGKQIEKFEDKEFAREARAALEEYAEAGMEILIENLFVRKWDGNKLDDSYDEYIVDIVSYVYGLSIELPF